MSAALLKLPDLFKERARKSAHWQGIVLKSVDIRPHPEVAATTLRLLDNPGVSAAKLSEIVGLDPGLAARVTRLANSYSYRSQSQIDSLEQAVMKIGLQNLKGTLLSTSLTSFKKPFSKLEHYVWQNSLATAITAKELAKYMRLEYADELYLVGLLHDMGKLVLARAEPNSAKEIFEGFNGSATYLELEEKQSPSTHPLVGALLGLKWNFPEDMCQIILEHHDSTKDLDPAKHQDRKLLIIQLANSLSHYMKIGHNGRYPDQMAIVAETSEKLRVGRSTLTKLSAAVKKRLSEVKKVLAS